MRGQNKQASVMEKGVCVKERGRTDEHYALSCVGEVEAKGVCGGTEGQRHTRPAQSCLRETGLSCSLQYT